MKSYTDLEQSKKLSEILPLESADMYWKNGVSDKYIQCFTPFTGDGADYDYDIPCWSLAALLKMLPLPTLEETMITTTVTKWKCTIYDEYHAKYWSELHNDAIDAVFEMVCWLSKK